MAAAQKNSKILFEAQGVSKEFGGLRVIDDVSLTIPTGQRTALIGPNGAGKTMFFNLITGIFAPTSGRLIFNELDITEVPAVHRIRHGLARTFQNVRLMNHLTTLENVLLGQHHRAGGQRILQPVMACRRCSWAQEALSALADARLDRYADTLVGNLPFGLRKQIELVRAMVARPKMLLLDEPAAGLNATEANALKDQLVRIADAGTTILVIEHNMDFVGEFCETLIALNFGRKIAEGTPEEVRMHPEVRQAYLGIN